MTTETVSELGLDAPPGVTLPPEPPEEIPLRINFLPSTPEPRNPLPENAFDPLRVTPFSEAVLQEAEDLLLTDEIFEGREIERGVIAIDPVGSRDRDDALRVETDGDGYIMHVSIADVPALVKMGSLVDRAAVQRVFTRYYGEAGDDPMIPAVLSEDRLSLHQGQRKLAVTVSVPIGKNLDFGGAVVRRTVLEDGRAMTYPEADKVLKDDNDPDTDQLRLIQELALRMAAARKTYYNLDEGVETSEENRRHQIRWGEAYQSMVMVREFMIRANMAFSEYAAANWIPYLFRGHDGEGKLGYYTTEYMGHSGLGLGADQPYSHSTSPMRRLSDMINQRSMLEGTYAPQELDEIAEYINYAVDSYRPIADGTRAAYMKESANNAARKALTEGGDLKDLVPRRLLRISAQEDWIRDKRVRKYIYSGLKRRTLPAQALVPVLFSKNQDRSTRVLVETIIRRYPGVSRETLEEFCGEKGIPLPELRAVATLKFGDREVRSVGERTTTYKFGRFAIQGLIRMLRQDPDFQQYME